MADRYNWLKKLSSGKRNRKFLEFASKGNVGAVQALLSRGVNVNERHYDGDRNALMLASQRGHVEMVKLLVGYVDVNAMNELGFTALMIASQEGFADVVKLLLDRGVELNTRHRILGLTALVWACQNGHSNVVDLLLEAGADDEVASNYGQKWNLGGAFALIRALGDDMVASILLDWGFGRQRPFRKYGCTALMLACFNGHLHVVRLLLERRRGVSADMGKALMEACVKGHVKIASLLIERGADANAKDEDGVTALMKACLSKHGKIAEFLIKDCNADVNARDSHSNTALIAACESGLPKVFQLLIDHGADFRDDEGWKALTYACKYGHDEVVKLLIQTGIDVNAKNSDEWTCLMTACEWKGDELNYQRIVESLLQHGALIDVQNLRNGRSAVMMAVMRGKIKCLDMMLSRGAKLDLTDHKGKTAFTYAMETNNADCLRSLLVEGKLLTDGKLRHVHKNARIACDDLTSLLVTIDRGVFEWEWCPLKHYKSISMAAFRAGYCPGEIKYDSEMNATPLIVSLLENDTELTRTFTRHLYFYPEDYRMLSGNNGVRERIRNITAGTILDEITLQPMSLQSWCLMTISKAISVSGPPGLHTQRVDTLPIPERFKRNLRFQIQ